MLSLFPTGLENWLFLFFLVCSKLLLLMRRLSMGLLRENDGVLCLQHAQTWAPLEPWGALQVQTLRRLGVEKEGMHGFQFFFIFMFWFVWLQQAFLDSWLFLSRLIPPIFIDRF
ncbi:hypothetical protein MCOR25_007716 [Pyricularia grisea]|nr:hypothetical protein MCOR25_007716 [Pyricularia grisea]